MDDRVLVGWENADDAGVYLLDGDRALVQTVDFFTPIVDDPFLYGQIAAANALSDIYAMGGRPLTALAVCGFPEAELDLGVLQDTFRGGREKLAEAGVVLLGGHTVQDREMKFGYAITGLVHPRRIWRNSGARPGDQVLLTKPLGVGIITTAVKFGRCPEDVLNEAIRAMLTLNAFWVERLAEEPVHAVTDVTGFGFLGHLWELAEASRVSVEIDPTRVPLLPGVRELAQSRLLPGGLARNRAFLEGAVNWSELPEDLANILLDPQTSGGLLLSVPPELAKTLGQEGLACPVGRVVAEREFRIDFAPF
ncbi:MAG: selenide, water dikinase SelD [Acidobacteriota bacterium]